MPPDRARPPDRRFGHDCPSPRGSRYRRRVSRTRRTRRLLAIPAALALTLGILGVAATAGPAQAADSPNPHAPTSSASDGKPRLPLTYKDRGEWVRHAQQQLVWLGYDINWREQIEGFYGKDTKQAVLALQDKFFYGETGVLDARTWKLLQDVGNDPGQLPKICLSEQKVLCIDKSTKLLRYVKDGKVILSLDVRFGVPGLETPEGAQRVWFRWADATSGINGPDQPRAPMPWALFFNGSVAVHYSPTFAYNGYYPGGGSHGCVNVADLGGVRWLFYQIPVGTLVYVYWS